MLRLVNLAMKRHLLGLLDQSKVYECANLVVACRYWFERTDGYWGQFTLTQLPHVHPQQLLPSKFKHLDSMQNFVGMLEYLNSWTWAEQSGVIKACSDVTFRVESLPLRISDSGEVLAVSEYIAGQPVFQSDRESFEFMVSLTMRDLQYRGLRNERVSCYEHKQQANFLLYRRVLQCDCDAEYEALRQHLGARW